MTTTPERITPLLAGMDTVYFSCDLPLSDVMRERLPQEKAILPAQQQPKLTPAQQVEARRMLAKEMTLRQVGRRFGVAHGAYVLRTCASCLRRTRWGTMPRVRYSDCDRISPGRISVLRLLSRRCYPLETSITEYCQMAPASS
jgi:hypothetical protein